MNAEKQARLDKANQMLRVIGSCGRRFFYSKEHDRYASLVLDARGMVFLIDDYTGERIYTHYRGRWQGFSHGGTLKDLIEDFRDYIMRNRLLPARSFGPWPAHYCGGDLWGYGASMQQVRDEAKRLGIVTNTNEEKQETL
jgi:hypothetical protein